MCCFRLHHYTVQHQTQRCHLRLPKLDGFIVKVSDMHCHCWRFRGFIIQLVLLRYVKYCFRSINDTINQNYRDNDTIRWFYNDHDWTHFTFCCCRSNRSNWYTCLLHCIRLHHTVFGRRMFTSDVRIMEFWIHILFARHFASTLMPASAITRFPLTSFVACDEAYCNLHNRFLVLFAMSFLDTRILIRKCSNIPTSNLRGDHCWPEI